MRKSTKSVEHVGTGLRCLEVDSGNYMAEAFAPAQEWYKLQVQSITWGHLAPKPRKKYKGFVLFTYTAWKNCVPIEALFDGLDCPPWFFDDLMEFVSEQCTDDRNGQVWRFDGTYTKNDNDTCAFVGTIRRVATGKV